MCVISRKRRHNLLCELPKWIIFLIIKFWLSCKLTPFVLTYFGTWNLQIFCNGCCNLKATLPIIDNKEARVCSKCYQDLIRGKTLFCSWLFKLLLFFVRLFAVTLSALKTFRFVGLLFTIKIILLPFIITIPLSQGLWKSNWEKARVATFAPLMYISPFRLPSCS